MKSCTQPYLSRDVIQPLSSGGPWRPVSHSTEQSPNLQERASEHTAVGRVWPRAKGKLEGILTTHLLATNLAVKCNQLVSPGSLCDRGRESKAPAEGHSVHPNEPYSELSSLSSVTGKGVRRDYRAI